jgi:hypothetical protein
MPRKTHPDHGRGHDRAHVREAARRYGLRRWRRAKAQHGDTWTTVTWTTPDLDRGIAPSRWHRTRELPPRFVHPDDARRGQDEADLWLFTRSLNEYARNFQTYCSCRGCSSHSFDDTPRSRARLAWQREWHAELEDDGLESAAPGRRALRSRHWQAERGI